MYKHVALLVRQAGMSHDEFVDYWQQHHTPIARDIEGVARYATVEPTDPDAAGFDGIAELYFDELAILHDALGSEGDRDYDPSKGKAKAAREDVDNFLAVEERPRLIGEEVVEKDETGGDRAEPRSASSRTKAGDTSGLYKHSAFLVRKDGMAYEEFLDHWANEHVPIAREIPGVVRYARVEPTDPAAAEFDGVAELYFEDLGALEASLGVSGSRDYDPDHPKALEAREDVDNFLAVEERPRLIGRETVQKDET